ncbi:hypothetical protein GOP47_0008947 [Adiantum capillus-veneris]|uniref:Uncharacterized protein n=1 Tax=Adiantum capillus-veneris TaxID=13818 RepID=A0A9D4ZK72_ADICA|nr:hypothetical protein GOP47_0008947 [Adiantum capillus-veneris]
MRPGLLLVLALWVSCISSMGWGKEGASEQGMFEQSTLLQHWSMRLSKAMSTHDWLWKIKGHLPLDVGTRDVVAVEKFNSVEDDATLPWLHNRQVPSSPLDRGWLGKDDVGADVSVLSKEEVSWRKAQVGSNVRYVEHIRPHENVRGAMRRMSLLDIVDGTTADKQANAVRRLGVDSAVLRYAGLVLATDTQIGAVYDVGLPPSLAGIRVQVMRISPASLTEADLILNEFSIPPGASFNPSGDYVALIYRKISSFTVYTLPPQYQFGGPVVGIMSSSSNSTTIDPSQPPGSISLPTNRYVKISLPSFSTSVSPNALCAFFASNGSIFVSSLAAMPSYCLFSTLGDFALVVEASSTTSPTQGASPPTATSSPNDGSIRASSSPSGKSSTNWKLIVGATCLALGGLALLVAVVLISLKVRESVKQSVKHFLTTRTYTGNDEALQDSLVGGSIAPSAPVMRTKPALEIDVAHFSH